MRTHDRPVIAVDMDEVLNELLPYWLDRYNHDYDDELSVEDLTTWDIVTAVKPACGSRMLDYLHEPDFFLRLPVKPGSQDVMDALCQQFRVFVTTAAVEYPESLVSKFQWLRHHFPMLPVKNIVFLGDKSIVRADLMIDDGWHNLEHFPGQGFLMDMPYNRNVSLPPRIRRVQGWTDVAHHLLGSPLIDHSSVRYGLSLRMRSTSGDLPRFYVY